MQKRTISRFVFSLAVAIGCLGCQGSDKTGDLQLSEQASSGPLVVEVTASDSISVLELLFEGHEVEYRSNLMGAFVTAIDSVENSWSGYWVYKVNDTVPKIACDKMLLLPGDRVKWLFQLSSESEPEETK